MGEEKDTRPTADDAGQQILDALARRAGFEIPPDRRQGVNGVLADLMRAAALVHSERGPGQWSAHVYRVETILRARDDQQ